MTKRRELVSEWENVDWRRYISNRTPSKALIYFLITFVMLITPIIIFAPWFMPYLFIIVMGVGVLTLILAPNEEDKK